MILIYWGVVLRLFEEFTVVLPDLLRIFWIIMWINVKVWWAISPWVFIRSTSNLGTMILRYWSLMIWFFEELTVVLPDWFRIFWIIMWIDVGSVMYMSGDQLYRHPLSTSRYTIHLFSNVSMSGQRRRQWPSSEKILRFWYGQSKPFNSSFTNFAFMRKLSSFTNFTFMLIPHVYMH